MMDKGKDWEKTARMHFRNHEYVLLLHIICSAGKEGIYIENFLS